VIPLPPAVKHREVRSERWGDGHFLLFDGTRSDLLQLAENTLNAAETQ
jgi:hypothetical protein